MKSLIILQTVVPDYRINIFNFIRDNYPENCEIFGGLNYFEKSVKTDTRNAEIHEINNLFFFKRSLLFQYGFWNYIVKDNIIILELNPRIISNWIILVYRRIAGYKTVVWGHAWPRKGRKSKSDRLRGIMRELSTAIITYSVSQKADLKKIMTGKTIMAAPNALYFKSQIEPLKLNTSLPNCLLYVGRITKKKKVLLLAEAFLSASKELPSNIKLIIVGDGEQKTELEHFISSNNIGDRIKTTGHISDLNSLKEIYYNSFFSVSPGYVGLSAIQSFGFGIPMLISEGENHSPEIEAAIPDFNTIFFEMNNVHSLSSKIKESVVKRNYFYQKREEISKKCRMSYSIEAMGNSIISLVKSLQTE